MFIISMIKNKEKLTEKNGNKLILRFLPFEITENEQISIDPEFT